MSLVRIAPLAALLTMLLPLAAAAQISTVDVDRCQIKKLTHAARYYSAAVRCVTSAERGGRDPEPCIEKMRARFAISAQAEDQKGGCLDSADLVYRQVDGQVQSLLIEHAPPKVVFRTSSVFSGDLGGIKGADAICRKHARNGGLRGRFVALLSTSQVDARDRVSMSPGGFVRPDGVFVAAHPSDLFDGAVMNSISVDEHGTSYGHNAEAWTGSGSTGIRTSATCEDWTSAAGSSFGINGLTRRTDGAWLSAYTQFCSRTNVVLLCVEQ